MESFLENLTLRDLFYLVLDDLDNVDIGQTGEVPSPNGWWCVKSKAAGGVIERVWIKRTYVPKSSSRDNARTMLVDSLNGVWMPNELVTVAEAKEMAQRYLESRLEGL